MVLVSADLIEKHVSKYEIVAKAYEVLERDSEVQELLKMANIMAVSRLLYNDHGPTHARIVAGSALEMFEILTSRGIEPSTLKSRTAKSLEESRLVVLMAAYLHDVGNSVHRHMHETHSYILALRILDRLLPQILDRDSRIYALRQEILHAIYAHQNDVQALTIEAGIVKVADGTDMAKGRARVPYRLGKADMHSVSALSIEKVEIDYGVERPIRITVEMKDMAGLFQIEEVMMPKVRTSGISDYIEIILNVPSENIVKRIL